MAKIQIRKIDHLVLRVRDINAMRAFYCDVLGAEHIAYRPKFAKLEHVGGYLEELKQFAPAGFNS